MRKDPLRTLHEEERRMLEQIARSQSEPASHVARAKILLAVADGKTYDEAAQTAERIHGARLLSVPQGGHVMLGSGDLVQSEIVEFLNHVIREEQANPNP